MNISAEHIEKVTLTLSGNPSSITSVYCFDPVKNPLQNDYYNNNIENILNDIGLTVRQDGIIQFKNQEERRCFYYNKFCKMDFAMDFSDIKILEGERIFIILNLRCNDDKEVLLWLGGRNSRIKVWINNRIVFNGISSFINCELFFLELSKGNNLVFIELGRILHDLELLKFSFRAAEYQDYVKGAEYEITESYINRDVLNKVQVIQEGWEIKGSEHRFKIIPRDFINVSQSDKVNITLKDSRGNIYEKIETVLGQCTEFSIDKFNGSPDGNNFLTMEIKYQRHSGEKDIFINTLIIGDAAGQVEIIKDRYNAACLNYQLSVECKNAIEHRIRNTEAIIAEMRSYYKFPVILVQLFKKTVNEISVILSHVKNGVKYSDLKIDSRIKHVYYISGLDGNEERYTIILPDNYSGDKKYPLVIFIPGNRYDDDVMLSQSELTYGDVILAEISCKGMTFGSYIGEATFLEAMNLIMNSYQIDKDRVYLSGICSGAYAAWALAQAYPSLFAAMVVSGGGPFAKNLHNLDNIKIKNICSDEAENSDKFYVTPAKVLTKPNGYYQAVLFKEISQNTLNFILCRSSYTVRWLMQHKRERYPQKIFYRTDRLRHNKTHWIEITRMENGKRYCKLEGELIDKNSIKLSLINISEFILKIPHIIDRSNMVIDINENQTLNFKDVKEDELCFKKAGNEYLTVDKTDVGTGISRSFGMGILDIYMDSLKIVIPSIFNSEKEEDIIRSIAKAFSNPITTGINPDIYINYPVITNKQINNNDIDNGNLLLIGQVYDELLSKTKDTLLLEFDDNGFKYKGAYKKGDYCIIMICPNPMNKNKKVLYIFANNYKLLKNVFTRKIIIPTYFNGIHPHLNNEVILFDGLEYYLIYSMGDDVQRL